MLRSVGIVFGLQTSRAERDVEAQDCEAEAVHPDFGKAEMEALKKSYKEHVIRNKLQASRLAIRVQLQVRTMA